MNLFVAVYDSSYNLLGVDIDSTELKHAQQEDFSTAFTVSSSGAVHARAFLWEGLDNFKSIRQAIDLE